MHSLRVAQECVMNFDSLGLHCHAVSVRHTLAPTTISASSQENFGPSCSPAPRIITSTNSRTRYACFPPLQTDFPLPQGSYWFSHLASSWQLLCAEHKRKRAAPDFHCSHPKFSRCTNINTLRLLSAFGQFPEW